MPRKQNKGFTLLEILLVIATIGILAAIVLVAINPNRQLAQARNAQRRADINTIYKALEQYLIDTGSYPNSINSNYKEICNTGSQKSTDTLNPTTLCDNKADLRELVPTYLASIPTAPSGGIYKAGINSNNKIAVYTIGENNQTLGVNYNPPTWTPSALGSALALWLDADDASTITLNGSTVSQWNDKSGNAKHAVQTTASLQPAYQATGFNGKPTLKFDATDDVFFIENTSANASGDFFIGAAFNFVTTAGNWLMIAGFRPAVAAVGFGQPILQRTEAFSRIGYHNTDAQAIAIDVVVTTLTGNKIATVGRNGGTAGNGGTATVTATGASGNYLSTGTQWWSSAATTNFQIAGRQQSGTAFSEKNISEIILCNRNLTTLERQQYEGYLAHKWGLVADLPNDHPYKNAPPNL